MHSGRILSVFPKSLASFGRTPLLISGPQTLTIRRIYLLPTSQGIIMALLLMVMLIGAINYNNSLGYLLTFILASMSLVSALHAFRNMLQLTVDTGIADPVFCDNNAQIPVIIGNHSKTQRYALNLFFKNREEQQCFDVEPNCSVHAMVPLLTYKRGRNRIPPLVLETRFPMGVFRAWTVLHFNSHYLVYPKPAGKNLDQYSVYNSGTNKHNANTSAEDFSGLRKYQAGDSLKHIHWKSVARNQELQTKRFSGGNDQECMLDWDNLHLGDTENKLSQLCKWVLQAQQQGVRYGLRLPDTELAPADNRAHHQQCLEALALYGLPGVEQ